MAKNKIKNDISSNWSKSTFIPKEGEIILYTDLLRIKIGDGIHKLNDLEFIENEYPPFNGSYLIK